MPVTELELDRFFSKVNVHGVCWEWEGSKTPDNYGRHWYRYKGPMAHRWVWEALVGEIPENYEIDHLCMNTLCVNPDHLEPVTGSENHRRKKSDGPKIAKERRTHCKHGHELTPDNTTLRRTANNARQCKTCVQIRNRKQYLKRSEGKVSYRSASKLSHMNLNTPLG